MHPHRFTLRLLLTTIIAGLLLPVTAPSQVIELTKITDEDTAIRGWGDSPALHAGTVAILADNQATGVDGLYSTPATGTGPFTLIVDENTPVPNRPGSSFDRLDNPAIFNGEVVFTGGDDIGITDGLYRGTGGPLEVLVDRIAGDPPPVRPAVDATGIVFEKDPDFFEPPFFLPADLSGPIQIAQPGAAAPGGGTFSTFDHESTPAIGGGLVSFTAFVTQPAGVMGVYTYDPASNTQDWIANGSTVIPGTALTFESFGSTDTDGESVVFTGHEGFLCCGGQGGVYLAPANSSGAGPFTVLAEVEQAVPGNPNGATFESFAEVAVDGDLAVLTGFFFDSVTGDTETGLYGFRDGALFKIIDSTDELDGSPLINEHFTHRGLDGDQLVFNAKYEDPGAPFGQGSAIWVATIPSGSAAVQVSIQPLNPPVVIPPGGGSFDFTLTLTNTTAETQTFQSWGEMSGPVSRSPLLGPRTVMLRAGRSQTRTLTQQIPGNAPAGIYTYKFNAGTFGGAVTASDSFTFTKQ